MPDSFWLLLGGLLAMGAARAADAPAPSPEPAGPASDGPVYVAQYRGDKRGAVSFTFDDGTPDHPDVAVPLLNEAGYRGTFFVCTASIPDKRTATSDKQGKPRAVAGWDDWKAIAAQGHEVANHSATHPKLPSITDEKELERQILGSAAKLEEKTGATVVSFAYPFCARNELVDRFVFQKHLFARGYKPCYGNADFKADGAQKYIDEAIEKGAWHVALIHRIDGAPAEYKKHFAYLKTRDAEVWTDTYGNVGRYLAERKAAELKVTENVAGRTTFTLTVPEKLDRRLAAGPLTVVVRVAGAAANPKAAREGDPTPLTVQAVKGRVLVDVVPGAKPVLVTWTAGD